ncbi:hypothetical protein EKK58_00645 [Candidatus Dependentiae bacterium]|nr:MAG: hypothetical protein EKK58_00645 [Candidatus Dependentiae bacterium]
MNSLASNPQLNALGQQLGAAEAQPPAPASPTPTGGGTPPTVPPERNGGGDNNGGRHFKLPFWVAMVIAGLLVLFCGYKVVYSMNWNAPFAVSDKLDHQGAWYRQAALAPVDWVKSRQYYVEADFWGNKRVVYQVGDRRFVQTRSGEAAVEIYSSK